MYTGSRRLGCHAWFAGHKALASSNQAGTLRCLVHGFPRLLLLGLASLLPKLLDSLHAVRDLQLEETDELRDFAFIQGWFSICQLPHRKVKQGKPHHGQLMHLSIMCSSRNPLPTVCVLRES